MHENKNDAPASKVAYRPIEASIRWAGLLRYEQVILLRFRRQGTCRSRWTARAGANCGYTPIGSTTASSMGNCPSDETASRHVIPR